ncbi:hypothetical protein [Peribacillus tepidiphilus]|jgi:hypothetical protein|uniref:hypothetical protein n=1 Tax=Peribacillus tepidiphilus TaxID=2652445 RepID=UPI0035B5382B
MADLLLIIFVGILLFVGTNTLIYFLARGNKRKMIFSGILMLILAPFVFYLTLEFVANFDKGGFGASIFALFNGILYFINGIVIIFIAPDY